MKVSIFGVAEVGADGRYETTVLLGPGATPLSCPLVLTPEQSHLQRSEPVPTTIEIDQSYLPLSARQGQLWLYRDVVVQVHGAPTDLSELTVRVKHAVIQALQDHDRKVQRLHRMQWEVEAFEHPEASAAAQRQRIPDSVRAFVWQRDGGRCVKCGSRDRLEFDHIVPVADGGSNTARNIELLCEPCNRIKGRNVS